MTGFAFLASRAVELDQRLFLLVNHAGTPGLDKVFEELSSLGTWPVALLVLGWLADGGRRLFWRHAVALLLVLMVGLALNNGIKRAFDRRRPVAVFGVEQGQEEYVRLVARQAPRTNSFPSGHSAAAFCSLTYLALHRPGYRFLAFTLAALIAYSRVYVGMHFPSDCVAGALLGILGAIAAGQVFRILQGGAGRALPTST
jgi:undecaprenyl-diphosphatase